MDLQSCICNRRMAARAQSKSASWRRCPRGILASLLLAPLRGLGYGAAGHLLLFPNPGFAYKFLAWFASQLSELVLVCSAGILAGPGRRSALVAVLLFPGCFAPRCTASRADALTGLLPVLLQPFGFCAGIALHQNNHACNCSSSKLGLSCNRRVSWCSWEICCRSASASRMSVMVWNSYYTSRSS